MFSNLYFGFVRYPRRRFGLRKSDLKNVQMHIPHIFFTCFLAYWSVYDNSIFVALLAPQEGGNNVGVWDARTGAMRFSFTLKNMTVLWLQTGAEAGSADIGIGYKVQNEASKISLIL